MTFEMILGHTLGSGILTSWLVVLLWITVYFERNRSKHRMWRDHLSSFLAISGTQTVLVFAAWIGFEGENDLVYELGEGGYYLLAGIVSVNLSLLLFALRSLVIFLDGRYRAGRST